MEAEVMLAVGVAGGLVGELAAYFTKYAARDMVNSTDQPDEGLSRIVNDKIFLLLPTPLDTI